ncbi:hypothetical protein N8T08_005143 [Aspergillus melleus]|uniref:Uncharacterized protein n=1 Tax=Aspergillus melleus TaxID=138277 RepID=A0ACC3BFG6_9EURO|nr:hypothetical protein N8T08_005143 [Aspergillus melleus]
MADRNFPSSHLTTEAEQARIAYYCLIDFCPAPNGYDSDYHSRLLDLLENGCYTVWKDSFQGNEEYQQRPGWVRIHVDADVSEDKQHKVVIDTVRGRIIRNRESALLMEEVYYEHNGRVIDSTDKAPGDELDDNASVVGRVQSDSESCPDIVDAWVWIHIRKIKDLEERYWEARERLLAGKYTVYYENPEKLDNKKRELVMKLKITYHFDLENRSDEIENQLYDDIEGILEMLEAQRGAQGADPWSEDDNDDGESEDEEEVEGSEEESEDESQPQAQLRPKLSTPVSGDEDYDSEATTVMASSTDYDTGNESDADADSDVESKSQPRLKGGNHFLRRSDLESESELDTDDIVGGQTSTEMSEHEAEA